MCRREVSRLRFTVFSLKRGHWSNSHLANLHRRAATCITEPGAFATFSSNTTSIMKSSTDKALGIPELFEAILLELPAKDLLLVQRVSKMWHELILESPKIQEALFFKVRPISSLAAAQQPVINPLLQQMLKPHRGGARSYGERVLGVRVQSATGSEKCRHCDDATCQSDFYIYIDLDGTGPPARGTELRSGSWREMYVSNPPCPVRVEETHGLPGCGVENMGIVLDSIKRWLESFCPLRGAT